MPRRVALFDPERRKLELRGEELPEPRPGQIVWIDVESPTHAELDALAERFGLHHLAIEDCLHVRQRPKLETYDGHVFLVMHHPDYDASRQRVTLGEIELFLGLDFVITSHVGPLGILDVVRERWEESEESGTAGASFLAYLIADTIVDDYFPVLDKLERRLEHLDDRVFRDPDDTDLLLAAFKLKKQLLHLRRVVGPTRDLFIWLVRHEAPLLSRTAVLHFQDVYDHLIRVSDTLDLYRDLAGGVQETHLTMVANRTNVSMKRLTAFTITLMSVTLIASIYGMNFRTMPELGWPYGYAWAMTLMAAAAAVSLGIFRWRGYF